MPAKKSVSKSRVTSSKSTRSHIVLPGSKRGKQREATVVGKVDPKEQITVTINLAGPKLPDADEYVGQTLTPEEFSQKFSAKKEDADAVTAALKKYGLKVENVSLTNRSMRATGTAAAMEAAFQPNLVLMRSARQGQFRGREGSLMIPAELKGMVTGVFGLDNRRMAHRKSTAAAGSLAVSLQPLT